MYLFLNEILEEDDSLKNLTKFMSNYVGETTDGKLLGIESENKETGRIWLLVQE